MKVPVSRCLILEPNRGAGLYRLDHLRRRLRPRMRYQQVNVIFDRSSAEQFSRDRFNYTADVCVEVGAVRIGEKWLSMFGRENEVDEYSGEGLGHGKTLWLRPFRADHTCERGTQAAGLGYQLLRLRRT